MLTQEGDVEIHALAAAVVMLGCTGGPDHTPIRSLPESATSIPLRVRRPRSRAAHRVSQNCSMRAFRYRSQNIAVVYVLRFLSFENR